MSVPVRVPNETPHFSVSWGLDASSSFAAPSESESELYIRPYMCVCVRQC